MRASNYVSFGIRDRRAKLVASATDGKRALEITTESDSDDHVIGEWQVNRAFLEACARVLESEGLCVLLVNNHGLRKARIMDVESLAERATVSWHEEAASTQITIGELARIIHDAQLLAGHQGTWFAVQGRYLADMGIVSKACGKTPLSVFPPKTPTQPVYFEATSDSAQWRGCIMPVQVTHPGGLLADDDEHPNDIGSSASVRKAVDDLREVLDEHGATLTVHPPTDGADDGVLDDDYRPEGAAKLKTEKAPKAKKAPAAAPKKGKRT